MHFERNRTTMITAAGVSARPLSPRRRTSSLRPPHPTRHTTSSLLTIPGAVEANGTGDCSRDPGFGERCEIAISQPGVAGPPTAPSGSGERVRAPPWLPVSGSH